MVNGTIKKVVNERGFGFITADDGKDYFFHRSGLDSSIEFDRLSGGEKVEFEIESSAKGPRAARIRAASSPRPSDDDLSPPRPAVASPD